MRNILVTGGAGFIGSNFVRYSNSIDPNLNIIVLDSLTYAGSKSNLKELISNNTIKFIKGDITDQDGLSIIFKDYDIDTVVHFAAESHVDRSILDPGVFIKTNVLGTYNLLECARTCWDYKNSTNYRFHHVSTDEVYGSLDKDDAPFAETTSYDPHSPYSASKASSDHIVRSYFHTYGLPVTISNCSNNYGPYQFPEKFIPLTILNALQGKPIPIYGDGKQIRDWLYVDDHCEALIMILKLGRIGETYNIGGGNQPMNIEVVETICDILDEMDPRSSNIPHKNLIQFVKDRPGHDRRYAINYNKILNELNWKPKFSLISGLKKTISWYIENQEWIQSICKEKNYSHWITENYINREME